MLRHTLLKLLPCILGGLFLASCQNDAVEPTEKSTKVYSDSISARAAVHTLYRKGLPSLYLSTDAEYGVPIAWGSYVSGLFESEATEGFYPSLSSLELSSPSVQALSQQIYTTCFEGIEAADSVITLLPQTSSLKSLEQARLIGEAKFFRAFNRFYLLRTFGTFPEKRNYTTYLSLDAAYAMVEKDLLEAIATLPEKSFMENNSHITAFVARALLGEVYLQMSGKPLQKNRYLQAIEILRPIIHADKHHLATNSIREEMSAFNTLRTTSSNDEYLYVIYGRKKGVARSSFAFPQMAKEWGNVKEEVAFNAFKPTSAFMTCYEGDDLRGKDRQFFHTFFKVKEDGKTVFEIFDPAPYFWLSSGTEVSASNLQTIGLYRFAEILLMAAEAIVHEEGVTMEAASYLAKVRARSVSSTQAEFEQEFMTMSEEQFLQEVWKERLRELPFEMKHLSDIVRTDFYPISKNGVLRFVPLEGAMTSQGHKLGGKSLYLPIP